MSKAPSVPSCPGELSSEIGGSIRQLGKLWASSPSCPRIAKTTVRAWDTLLASWRDNPSLPLLVRKASGAVRGSELIHASGRPIVPTDNSPAQWACSLALRGIVPTIEEVRAAFVSDTLPVAFAHKSHEKDRRRYHCTLGKHGINKAGWKLCHIQPVGLRGRGAITDFPIDDLKIAFYRLLSPSNYFLLPLAWGGLGEVSEFVDGFVQTMNGQSE